jgi:two-component system sensor histidine kinase KdpD
MVPLHTSDSIFRKFLSYLLAIISITITTVILYLLREWLNTSTIALLYLIPVLTSTIFGGLGPGVFSAFLVFLLYNFFFLLPYYTFVVHQTQDIVALVIFLIVAVLISQLLGRAKTGLEAAIAREAETTRLYELSLALAGVNNVEEITALIAYRTAETVRAGHVELHILPIFEESPITVSAPAGVVSVTEPDIKIPLKTVRANLGEIRLWMNGQTMLPSEERVLHAFAAQGALAIERAALAHTENRAKVLEESDRLKSALLSSVSHEFRTPLATIKAATTSLLSDEIPWEAPARKDLLSAMDEETDHLNYLVGNLLDMSRIEAGALKPNRQWNILAEILDGVMMHMYRALSKYKLEMNIPDDLPLVPVDYTQMEQVFTNLLNNSMKYAPEGSKIQIVARVDDSSGVLVQITNEGPQVATDHLERIFDKFYRVTAPERVTGTGLGLSICKGIIEAHGGRIWAENLIAGFAFVFTLPLSLDGVAPPAAEAGTR